MKFGIRHWALATFNNFLSNAKYLIVSRADNYGSAILYIRIDERFYLSILDTQ